MVKLDKENYIKIHHTYYLIAIEMHLVWAGRGDIKTMVSKATLSPIMVVN